APLPPSVRTVWITRRHRVEKIGNAGGGGSVESVKPEARRVLPVTTSLARERSDAASVGRRALRTHQGHWHRRRWQQRREPHDPRRNDGRRRSEERRVGKEGGSRG